jgi:hypothetical protein
MSKRPAVDLAALTAEAAAPMTEASQRVARSPSPAAVSSAASLEEVVDAGAGEGGTKTANLQALAFKVSPAFRKRFRQRAANADLKLNELLFEALDAWEEQKGLKK